MIEELRISNSIDKNIIKASAKKEKGGIVTQKVVITNPTDETLDDLIIETLPDDQAELLKASAKLSHSKSSVTMENYFGRYITSKFDLPPGGNIKVTIKYQVTTCPVDGTVAFPVRVQAVDDYYTCAKSGQPVQVSQTVHLPSCLPLLLASSVYQYFGEGRTDQFSSTRFLLPLPMKKGTLANDKLLKG